MRKFLITFALASVAAAAGELFPLQDGNEWTYREGRTGETWTLRVATPAVINDRVYYSLLGFGAQRLYVRTDERGNVVTVDPETYREQTLILFEVLDRAWWNAPFRICEQEGQTQPDRLEYKGPAGVIPGSVEVKYRAFGCADAGTEQEIYAENIGMLRRVEQSIAGPRTYELVSARIGKRTIQADQHGRFTVSVQDNPARNELSIRVELNVDPVREMRLRFPSGQQYDVQIRNSADRVVWQWSDDQMFSQALSDRLVIGRWVIDVKAPRPSFQPPESNQFIVQAWLPTIGGPQFAASAPFVLTAEEK